MRIVCWLLLTLAVLGVLGTFAVESAYSSQAKKVQLVQVDRSASTKFGPATTDVGEPEFLIVDPKALLANKTPFGDPMVDAGYLAFHGEPVIRMESIHKTITLARLGCFASIVLAAAGLMLLKRSDAGQCFVAGESESH